jgi:pSer/pThr/pTyr-binding forkhead associated (FHA) protein
MMHTPEPGAALRGALRRLDAPRRLLGGTALLACLLAAAWPAPCAQGETAQRAPGPQAVIPAAVTGTRDAPIGVEQFNTRPGAPAGSAPAAGAPERRPRERNSRETQAARRTQFGLFAMRGEQDWEGWLVRAALALPMLPAAIWLYRRPRIVHAMRSPGFEVISPSEERQWVPLDEKYTQFDFVTKLKTRGALRLSANLNKVALSNRKFGYLMEDKNFRNALLVNRRRVRRTLLKDGDVLDLGDLTLLYRDHRASPVIRYSPVTPPEGKVQIKFGRPRGPIRRGLPMLVSETQPPRNFYIAKNLVFIGRSEDNDLVIKSQNVLNRHARIERVGGRYKLQDLSTGGNTYVNGRRVEQRYLREGDEVAFDAHRFKFSLVTRPVHERPQAPEPVIEEAAPETEEMTPQEEAAPFAPEPDTERPEAPPRA